MHTFKPIKMAKSDAENTTYFVSYNGMPIGVIGQNMCGWAMYDFTGSDLTNTWANRKELFRHVEKKFIKK